MFGKMFLYKPWTSLQGRKVLVIDHPLRGHALVTWAEQCRVPATASAYKHEVEPGFVFAVPVDALTEDVSDLPAELSFAASALLGDCQTSRWARKLFRERGQEFGIAAAAARMSMVHTQR